MKKIVTFGEIMLRLTPPGHTRFLQADSFRAMYGGAEANVAVSLARFGLQAAFVTRLPENDIAQSAVNYLRSYGVDTSFIARGGSRMGLYYLEKGASERPNKVIYDRAGSAVAEASREDFDWDTIFGGCGVFCFSGITPALSENTAAILRDACAAAKAKGILTVCDLNYRPALWSAERAGRVMREFTGFTDLLVANENHLSLLFGIKTADAQDDSTLFEPARYEEIAVKVRRELGVKDLAVTIRKTYSAEKNDFAAMLSLGGECRFSPRFHVDIVDRAGGGDAFTAGLIYSLLTGKTPAESVRFAAAACALSHTMEGDANLASAEEVEALAAASGKCLGEQ